MIYYFLHPYNHKKVQALRVAGKTPPKGGAFSSMTSAQGQQADEIEFYETMNITSGYGCKL